MSEPQQPARIVLCGATGRTGNAVLHALVDRPDVQVLGAVAPSLAASPTRAIPLGVAPFASLDEALASIDEPRIVVVDLTHAAPALHHARTALERGCHLVLGATGIEPADLASLGRSFSERSLGLFEVPNFSIGAVLMMQAVARLAPHFGGVEIIESHHPDKRDSPSGTAVRTARLVSAARRAVGVTQPVAGSLAGDSPARGELVEGVHVHALRIPGATAHQSVVFGSPGELLTIRHDAIDRGCYAAGVALAARHVESCCGLVTGLEHAL